ncbi:uncharacterized protein MELLADRAFT_108217 [Melampsora larici-populina 98AG31]|nr:uncharacterized protein MELLADRAFT_108217 [Melampsora larici-populina 98AG31]EGG04576.1 hypothetical protein MELLADRAFT_108217 [Melampsora larici-populina 98AG31]
MQHHCTRDSESTIPAQSTSHESTIPTQSTSHESTIPAQSTSHESTIPAQSTSQNPYNQSYTPQGGDSNPRMGFHQFNPTLTNTPAYSGPQAFGWHPQQLPVYPISMGLGATYPNMPVIQTTPISHPQGSGTPFILFPPSSNFNPYTQNMPPHLASEVATSHPPFNLPRPTENISNPSEINMSNPSHTSTTSATLDLGDSTRHTTANSGDPSRTSIQRQSSTSTRQQSSSASGRSLEVPQSTSQRSHSPAHSLTDDRPSQLFRESSHSRSSSSHSSQRTTTSARRDRSTRASGEASTSRRSPSPSPERSDVSSSEESDESNSGSESDLDVHQRQHYQRQAAHSRSKITKSRRDGVRFEKLTEDQGPSKNEQLSICIQDYCKLLLGVTRKVRGQRRTSTLPSPPSETEISKWEKRKKDRKTSIAERIKKERERFLKYNPAPKRAELKLIEEEATKKAVQKLKPAIFTSRVSSRNSTKFSTTTSNKENDPGYNSMNDVDDDKEARDKISRANSRKRVSTLRAETFKKYFPDERQLHLIILDSRVHSEDELDKDNHQFRRKLPWRKEDFDTLLNLLGELCIHLRMDPRGESIATKALRRGDHVEMSEEDKSRSFPPKKLPRSLVRDDYVTKYLTMARQSELALSPDEFDLKDMIAKLRRQMS